MSPRAKKARSTRTRIYPPTTDPRDRFITESQIQRGHLGALKTFGWHAYVVGQYKAKGTQTPGVSDILAFHDEDGILFIESKRPQGYEHSDAQRKFQRDVEAAGGTYILAPLLEPLVEQLQQLRARRLAPR